MFVYVFIAISVYFIKSIRPVDLRGLPCLVKRMSDETNGPTTTYKRPPLRCVAMYVSGPFFSTLNFGIIL